MANGSRLRRTAMIGVLLGGLLAADASGMVEAAGVDVWNLPTLEKQLRADRQFLEALEVKESEVLHRMAVKESLIADLLEGRRTLADVTAEFRTLNAEQPELRWVIRNSYGCADEREATARNVLSYAGVCRRSDDYRTPAAARLHAEFAATFGHAAD